MICERQDYDDEPGKEHVFHLEKQKKKKQLVATTYEGLLQQAIVDVSKQVQESKQLEDYAEQYASLIREEVRIEEEKRRLHTKHTEECYNIINANCSDAIKNMHEIVHSQDSHHLFIKIYTRTVTDIANSALRINHYGRKNK